MIKPISFGKLYIPRDIKPILDRTVAGKASKESYDRNMDRINKLSKDKDVFLKASYYDPRDEESPDLSPLYDFSDTFVKLQVADKDNKVLAEVKTCVDEPQGVHEYCVAKKLNMLADKFENAMNGDEENNTEDN